MMTISVVKLFRVTLFLCLAASMGVIASPMAAVAQTHTCAAETISLNIPFEAPGDQETQTIVVSENDGCAGRSFGPGEFRVVVIASTISSGQSINLGARGADGTFVPVTSSCTPALAFNSTAPHGTTTCTLSGQSGSTGFTANVTVQSSVTPGAGAPDSSGALRDLASGTVTVGPVVFSYTPPIPVLSLSAPANPGRTFNLTLTSDQPLDFNTITASDIVAEFRTTVSAPVFVSPTEFTFPVTAPVSGSVSYSVAAGQILSLDGVANAVRTQIRFNVDGVGPIGSYGPLPSVLGLSTATIDLTFNEDVIGDILPSEFTGSGIVVTAVRRNGPRSFSIDVQASLNSRPWLNLVSGAVADAAGNPSAAAVSSPITTFSTRPSIRFESITQPDPRGTFGATFFISEFTADPTAAITDFSTIQITNGAQSTIGAPPSAVAVPGGRRVQLYITPTGGPVTVAFPEGFALGQNSNNPSTAFGPLEIAQVDLTRPSGILSGLAPNVGLASDAVTVTFDEAVTGFDLTDLSLTNLTASNLQTSDNTTFTFDVVASGDGVGRISIPNAAATDSVGNTSTSVAEVVTAAVASRPEVSFTGSTTAGAMSTNVFQITIPSGGTVNFAPGFGSGNVSVTGGTLVNTSVNLISGILTLSVTADGGAVTIGFPDGMFVDQGSGNTSPAFAPVQTDDVDLIAPQAALSGLAGTVNLAGDEVTLDFGETVTGFELTDLTISATLSASNLQDLGSGLYTFDVVAVSDGAGSISLAAGLADDLSGNGNTAATQVTTTAFASRPEVAIVGIVVTDAPANEYQISFSVSIPGGAGITLPPIFVPVFTNFNASPAFSATILSNSSTTFSFSGTATGGPITLTLPAGEITDNVSGNSNLAVGPLFVADLDITAPTITIAPFTGALNGPQTAVITLSEDATDFTDADLTLTNATAVLSGSGSSYTAVLTPVADGPVALSVAAATFTDAAGNDNEASNEVTVNVDLTAPTITIAPFTGALNGPQTAVITLSEDATDFTDADLTLTNATAVLSGSGSSYTAVLTPVADGPVALSVAAATFTDAAGNDNEASNEVTVTVDITAPTITIAPFTGALNGPQTAVITLSEDATDFTDADLTLTNATAVLSGSGSSYTAVLTPVADGPVALSVAAATFTDAAGNDNEASNEVTVTVDLTAPTVAVSGTPAFPGDPYPIDIIFNEPVNGFVLADITGDGALISDFVNGCATDPCATFSAVVNPSSGREFSHSVSVAANVAQDPAGNGNIASPQFSPPPPDGVAPVVTISGVPNGFTGPITATVTFDWAEDVLGFDVVDISVTGGTLGPITGGRQTWTAELTVTGTTDVTVTVAGGAVQDATGTPSVAATVTGAIASGAVAEEIIQDFMGARGAALIAAQPSLTNLLGNTAPSGTALVTRGAGTVQLHTGSEGPVWAALNSNWSNLDGFETAYTNLSFGTHMYLADETLLGVMLQFDHAASVEGLAEVEGMGWLIGPYYVARYGGVDVDARLLWGRTSNEISPFGTYRDTFETERVLAMVNLSGEIEAGDATLRPLLGWSYVDDRSEAYVDALNNPVAAQRVQLGQLEAALDWTMPLGANGIEFTGGIAGLFTSEEGGNGAIDGTRGRIDLGLRRQNLGPLDFDLGVYADGLGQSGFEAYGLDLSVDWRF